MWAITSSIAIPRMASSWGKRFIAGSVNNSHLIVQLSLRLHCIHNRMIDAHYLNNAVTDKFGLAFQSICPARAAEGCKVFQRLTFAAILHPIGLQHIVQMHDAQELVDIGATHHGQQVRMRCAHAVEGQVQGVVRV